MFLGLLGQKDIPVEDNLAHRNGGNEGDDVAYQSNPARRLVQTDIPVADNIAYLPHSNGSHGHQDEDYVN